MDLDDKGAHLAMMLGEEVSLESLAMLTAVSKKIAQDPHTPTELKPQLEELPSKATETVGEGVKKGRILTGQGVGYYDKLVEHYSQVVDTVELDWEAINEFERHRREVDT